MMKITAVDNDSPFYGSVFPGDRLVRINGREISDELDYRFYCGDEKTEIEIVSAENGEIKVLTGESDFGDPGLEVEETKIRVCKNNCIFCFVHQQPKGMRRSLYIKDDDYRYSFLYGNYISLSGISDDDYDRIIEQRLSPLYISIHSTDDDLRREIFGNEKLPPILPAIRRLVEGGIELHAQTVVCPGINDGKQLDKTISDLFALAPGVNSLAVVPVGLTKYRERLPGMRAHNMDEAAEVINQVERYHEGFIDRLGSRFVFPADEFFLKAGLKMPPLNYYEEMLQFENGVGMARQFMADFNRRRRYLPKKLKHTIRLELITGRSAEPFVRSTVLETLEDIENLEPVLTVVDNRFWGETVMVTGLLTAEDILESLDSKADITLLPPNCMNMDGMFLDDVSLGAFSNRAGRPILTGTYNIAALIREAVESREMS